MAENKDDILIRIDGKTFRLRPEKPQDIKKIPWPQRKKMIQLLVDIKQAEYVKSPETEIETGIETDRAKQIHTTKELTTKPATQTAKKTRSQSNRTQPVDSDAMMQQLLLAEKSQRPTVPTKTDIYKWFLIIFSVILALVLIF